MIQLRKMNNELFLVNHNQIECIELIPECKVVMMNHDYYLVKDTVEEIIQKIAAYNAKVQDIHRELSIVDKRR
ncbi:MAG: flagellar FlbD family protein [Oscillospiraceae bacterium]|nr:flagellar FlbD family protein [Clostridiales bacterium]MBS6534120.1 flagellar FlbD family protein [Oscillospiraceae bacterium]